MHDQSQDIPQDAEGSVGVNCFVYFRHHGSQVPNAATFGWPSTMAAGLLGEGATPAGRPTYASITPALELHARDCARQF